MKFILTRWVFFINHLLLRSNVFLLFDKSASASQDLSVKFEGLETFSKRLC